MTMTSNNVFNMQNSFHMHPLCVLLLLACELFWGFSFTFHFLGCEGGGGRRASIFLKSLK